MQLGGASLRDGSHGVDDAPRRQVVRAGDLRPRRGLGVALALHDARALKAQLHASVGVDGVVDAGVQRPPASGHLGVRRVHDGIGGERGDIPLPYGEPTVSRRGRDIPHARDTGLLDHAAQQLILDREERRVRRCGLTGVDERAEGPPVNLERIARIGDLPQREPSALRPPLRDEPCDRTPHQLRLPHLLHRRLPCRSACTCPGSQTRGRSDVRACGRSDAQHRGRSNVQDNGCPTRAPAPVRTASSHSRPDPRTRASPDPQVCDRPGPQACGRSDAVASNAVCPAKQMRAWTSSSRLRVLWAKHPRACTPLSHRVHPGETKVSTHAIVSLRTRPSDTNACMHAIVSLG